MEKEWSESARKDTIEKLESGDLGFAPEGKVCFKHISGRYGVITVADVVANHYTVTDRKSGGAHQYESAEDLVRGGWVLD